MKWLLALCFGLLGVLGSCGTRTTFSDFTAGDLLGTPTVIKLAGRNLKVESTPVLDGDTFNVKVRVQTGQKSMPALDVTGVYAVTEDGVWRASFVRSDIRQPCGTRCVQGIARGPARGLRPGQGIQVIVNFKSAEGKLMWLRDSRVHIQQSSSAFKDKARSK